LHADIDSDKRADGAKWIDCGWTESLPFRVSDMASQGILFGHLLVDSREHLVIVVVACCDAAIIQNASLVWNRVERGNQFRLRCDQVRRDDIARELRTSRGIDDRFCNAGEVALEHRRSWNDSLLGKAGRLPGSVIGGKKESSIFADGAAEGRP